MYRTIPIFYTEYGRYIGRFRAMPLNIDGLKIVDRRLLLALYQVARHKFTKSAKVVGHAIGTTHPHGDISTYGALIKLVQNGYADGHGNWGSRGLIEDQNAAAYRYTECKLNKDVLDFCFKYIDYVPWETLEMEPEPLYLPCPLPIGLIGDDIISGISFHSTCIPKYTAQDLAKRLKWILENKKGDEPIIAPNMYGCTTSEISKDDFKSILENGSGEVLISPDYQIIKKEIHLLGKPPGKEGSRSFTKLIKGSTAEKNRKRKYEIRLIDQCGDKNNLKHIHIIIKPEKRNIDINDLQKKLWDECLKTKIKFNCIFSTIDSTVERFPIDQILINCYNNWKDAVLLKRVDDVNKKISELFQIHIIEFVRYILNKNPNIKLVDDIIKEYRKLYPKDDVEIDLDEFDFEKEQWITTTKKVTPEEINKVCGRKSIKALIESPIDKNNVMNEIAILKKKVLDTDVDCYNEIKKYSGV